MSANDSAEMRRSMFDEYLRSTLSHPAASRTKALRAFLRESDRPDWPPAVGAIDLRQHDLPHDSSVTEWWYLNTHFHDADGNAYSAFAAFFRVLKHVDKSTGKKSWAHALNWAITDVTGKRYVQQSILDRDSPAIVKEQLKDNRVIKDPRLKKAYLEVLDRGNVPLPDRMFSDKKGDPVVSLDKLWLDFEGADFSKDEATGDYILRARTPDGKAGFDFKFQPRKPAVRHGLDGVVKGHDGDDMVSSNGVRGSDAAAVAWGCWPFIC